MTEEIDKIFNNINTIIKAIKQLDHFHMIELIVILLITFIFILFIMNKKIIESHFDHNSIQEYSWPSSEIGKIHIIPEKLSLTPGEAVKYKDMLLYKIHYLRNEKVSGKQFLIDFRKCVFVNEECKEIFFAIIDGAIKKNIVRLVLILPKKIPDNAYGEFLEDMKNRTYRYNRPSSLDVVNHVGEIYD